MIISQGKEIVDSEFTWYETSSADMHDLESDLIDRDFEEL